MGHLLAEEEWRNSTHFRFSKVNLYPGSSSVGLSNFGMYFVVVSISKKPESSMSFRYFAEPHSIIASIDQMIGAFHFHLYLLATVFRIAL